MSESLDPRRRFVTGLDLGQARDFTAIAVLERTRVPPIDPALKADNHYAVRHLERRPLGHGVHRRVRLPREAVRQAAAHGHDPRRRRDRRRPARRRSARYFAHPSDLRPITITGGHEAHPAERMGWKVPKKCLVSTLQVLLQGRRLTVAKSLPFAAALVEELQNFQVKVTEAANETFGALGDGYHDDLVLAIMIAAWAASMCRRDGWGCGWGRMRMWECETTVADEVTEMNTAILTTRGLHMFRISVCLVALVGAVAREASDDKPAPPKKASRAPDVSLVAQVT